MSAVEQFDSRIGEKSIVGTRFIKRYLVTADSTVTDTYDPLNDSQLPAYFSEDSVRPGPVVSKRILVQRVSDRCFIVDVVYDYPISLSSGGNQGLQAWQINYNLSADNEIAPWSLPDSNNKVTIIGPNKYRIAKKDEPHTHLAGDTPQLKLVKESARIKQPVDRKKPTATVVLSRYIIEPNLSVASSYITYLNESAFLGAAPECLQFINMNAETDPGYADGQQRTQYHLSLVFSWNPDGWQHKIYHSVIADNEDRDELLVMNLDGSQVQETFKLYKLTDFLSMIRAIENGN